MGKLDRRKIQNIATLVVVITYCLFYPIFRTRAGLLVQFLGVIPILLVALYHGITLGAIGGVGLSLYISLIRYINQDPDFVLPNALLIALISGIAGGLFGALSDQRRALRGSEALLEERVKAQTAELEQRISDQAALYNQLQSALEKEQSTRAQLVQSEKLAAMGRLIASVAHELNNPLQAIQNALYLVKTDDDLSSQAREDLEVALTETTRMADLLDRLREAYRPTTDADYQLDSLNILVTEVHRLMETHLRHSEIECVFALDPNLPAVPMMRDQIKQVILNLSVNAIETMPIGGYLTITTKHEPEENLVQLIMSDTGAGIPEEILPNIFDPFFTTKEGGTGLGLAVSYEIIQNHNGTIEVQSQQEGGSTFTVSLPLKRS